MAELGAPASYLSLPQGRPGALAPGRAGRHAARRGRPTADGFDALVVDVHDRLRVALADEVEAIHEGGVVLAVDTGACARLPEAAPAA